MAVRASVRPHLPLSFLLRGAPGRRGRLRLRVLLEEDVCPAGAACAGSAGSMPSTPRDGSTLTPPSAADVSAQLHGGASTSAGAL
jgi:hypothetical protein